MANNYRPYKLFILVALLCFSGVSTSLAVNEHFFNSKKGAHFAADSTLTVQDDKFGTGLWSTIQKNIRATDIITLQLNEDTALFLRGNHTCKVDLEITYKDSTGAADSLATSLSIAYDSARAKSFNFRSSFKFTGGYYVKARILSVTYDDTITNTFPKVFMLMGDIYVDRVYKFDCSTAPTFSSPAVTFDNTNQRLDISWLPYAGADEYDLEFTSYDDSSSVGKEDANNTGSSYTDFGFLFDNNATRVTVSGNEYDISLVYNPGYIFYRVRAINYDTLGNRIEGEWSSVFGIGKNVHGFPNQYLWTGHENKMNWQYTAAYAEQGKRKEVTSYFDGSLRNRQSVTLNNTENKAIVGETIYDYQGRAGVTTLPAPIDSGQIEYYNKFNVDASDSEYNRKDFDSGACGYVPVGMDSLHGTVARGSSGYYSSSNPDRNTGFNAYLPDAQGYPFTLTQYTPDNTGRVKAKTVAGKTFRMGGGHETKYYYGKPAQEEVDRLFGNEVGNNSHYLQNMVIDANGQISVSYVDENGKTVATALAGEPPDNVKALPSYYPADSLTINLLTADSISEHPNNPANSQLSVYSLLATNKGWYRFTYKLFPGNYRDSNSCINICTDCLYDIKMEVSDDCGVDTIVYDSNFSYTQAFDTLCGVHNLTDTFKLYLYPGNYNISRLITVDAGAVNYYTQRIIKADTCKTYNDFLTNAISRIDFGGCYMNCSTCLADLGADTTFRRKYMDEIIKSGLTPTYKDTVNADTAYQHALADCNALCNEAYSAPCEGLYDAMLADVSLGGQYCLDSVSVTGDTITPKDAASMLNGDYQHPSPAYVNSAGQPDSVLINGKEYPPQDLTVKDFVNNWNPSWASSLVTYHPEYCYYTYCTKDSASNRWDYDFENTATYAEACSDGFLAPLGFCPCGVCSTSNPDPYFATGALGSASAAWMKHRMDKDITNGTPIFSLWAAAALGTEVMSDTLQGINTYTPYTSSDTNFCSSGCTGTQNMEWNLFKGMYMALKQHVQDSLENVYVTTTGGCSPYVACVGSSSGSCNSTIYASKTPRHYTDLNASKYANNFSSASSAKHYGDSVLTATCDSTCASYAYYWYNALDSCGAVLHSDSARLIHRLEEVCEAGCGVNHPGGASTTPHGVPDDSGDVSFEDVVHNVLGVPYGDTLCNGLVITAPAPWYDSNGLAGPPITYYKPSACVCGNIDSAYAIYRPDSISGDPNYANFGSFLTQYYGDTISDSTAWKIMAMCTDTCFFVATPLQMPLWMTCCGDSTDSIPITHNTNPLGPRDAYAHPHCCIICKDFDTALAHMHNIYPNLPGFQAGVATLAYDSLGAYETMVANYMNLYFGFNLTFDEYLAFDEECNNTSFGQIYLHDGKVVPSTLCNAAGNEVPPGDTNSCATYLMMDANYDAQNDYNNYMDSLRDSVTTAYVQHCMNVDDSFHLNMPFDEYHYTLYYYDQAGNLVKTTPPDGVHPISLSASVESSINNYRNKGTGSPTYPTDSMQTRYWYNTLNSPIQQVTPDGDTTRFWYDRLGRLVLSQNKVQWPLLYSYTQYDALGRIIEVGQLSTVPANLPDCFHCVSCTIHYGVYPVLPDTFARNDAELQNFINTGTKTQVTHTYYDTIEYTYIPLTQQHLRKRIASITYQDVYDNIYTDSNWIHSPNKYDNAIHYSYDIEGNVSSMLLDVPHDSVVHQRYKRVDYYYDLVSGKVDELVYQHDSTDQFIHVYQYDADNRITDVLTSRDSLYWEHDAGYQYYDHGPLAREVIGQRQVQGVDYAYTINGWLKGVNSSIINASYDMGHDGDVHGSNNTIGRDAYGESLNYFDGDYRAIGTSNAVASGLPVTSLYNGNIAGATYSINPLNPKTIGYTYNYDQLNRLVHTLAFKGIDTTTNAWAASDSMADFSMRAAYDENGNIITFVRHGNTLNGGHSAMDSLNYNYYKGKNQLRQVLDAVASGNYPNDIDNETDDSNYEYNSIGQLAKDSAGGLDTIEWTVYGKLWKIKFHNGDSLKFVYDPLGNRLEKQYYHYQTGHPAVEDTTMYTRDAQGNIMAIYNRQKDTVKTDEFDIYGAKRIGSLDTAMRVYPAPATHSGGTIDSATIAYLENQKQYELDNHLGNVLVTVSDKKIPVDTTGGNNAQYYLPNIVSAQDYYPFGMLEPGREYAILGDSVYLYGMNGMMKDNEIYGKNNAYTTKFRENDPRLGGRWWSMDPKYKAYESPYVGFSDNPIYYSDPSGDTPGPGDNGGTNNTDKNTGSKFSTYSVKPNDDLTQIAKKYKTTVNVLYKLNNGLEAHKNHIVPGEVINVPSISKDAPAGTGQNSPAAKTTPQRTGIGMNPPHAAIVVQDKTWCADQYGEYNGSNSDYDQPYGESFTMTGGGGNARGTSKYHGPGGSLDDLSDPIDDAAKREAYMLLFQEHGDKPFRVGLPFGGPQHKDSSTYEQISVLYGSTIEIDSFHVSNTLDDLRDDYGMGRTYKVFLPLGKPIPLHFNK